MKKNSAIITGLFMLMVLAFTIDPIFIYHFQNNILGKAIVILVLIYLTMNNLTFGLLFTLAIILISSRIDIPMIEGLRNKKAKRRQAKRQAKEQPKGGWAGIGASIKAQQAQSDVQAEAKDAKENKKTKKMKRREKRCKTLEELLREERLKRMEKKMDKKIENVAVQTPTTTNNETKLNTETNNTDTGVDRITVEETFRVRNPSTIPVTKEAFRVRQLNPSDNVSRYYGGSCSLI